MDLSCGEKLETTAACSETSDRLSPAVDRCSAGPDRALDTDPRIIHNLLVLERTHALHVNYFDHVQPDLEPYMRKIVTTWMLEVCEEQQCEEQVFPLSVSYMDRFLAIRPVSRKQLQLLAVTSMLLASKFRQCHPLAVDILCAYTDHSVEPDEVRQWEVMLLQCLNWQLSVVTAFDFVEPLLARVPWGRSNPLVRRHAHTLISVCYSESAFLLVPASLIALACVSAAARGLRVRGASVAQLCALTHTTPAAAELVARHVEKIVSDETRPAAEPRTPQHDKTAYSQPTTPTDVQDIQF